SARRQSCKASAPLSSFFAFLVLLHHDFHIARGTRSRATPRRQSRSHRHPTVLARGYLVTMPPVRAAAMKTSMKATRGVSMKGGVYMKGVPLKGVSLKGVSLKGVSMKGVSMKGVSMKGVSMKGKGGVSMKGVSMKAAMEVLCMAMEVNIVTVEMTVSVATNY